MSSFRWSWALVSIAFVGTACLDLTPTVVGVAEGGRDGASEEAQTACRECVLAAHEPGPGCADEFAACGLNDTCARIIACSFDDLCYGSTIKSYLACSAPCQSLLPAVDDPAVPLLLPLYNCATTGSCAAACFPAESKGDAGTASNPPISDAGAGAGGDASADGSTAGSCTNSADRVRSSPRASAKPPLIAPPAARQPRHELQLSLHREKHSPLSSLLKLLGGPSQLQRRELPGAVSVGSIRRMHAVRRAKLPARVQSLLRFVIRKRGSR